MKLNLPVKLETGVVARKLSALEVAIARVVVSQASGRRLFGVFYDVTRQRGMGHANAAFPIPFP